jgi:hypothetical protein
MISLVGGKPSRSGLSLIKKKIAIATIMAIIAGIP